ncbi:MAG: 1,4-dihydroxy-2-naphthoate octaprenyltransferase [Pseudomonadota bacterium]
MTTSAFENTISQKRSSSLKVWLRALRPESFPVSVVPALLGIAIAWSQGYRIDLPLALMTLVGAVAIHAATNLLQDYFDYTNGLDRPHTLGGSGVLVRGELAPSDILIASGVFFAISAALAVILIIHVGYLLLWFVAAGLILGAGYAIPRYGLKYLLLGDIAVFAAFGIGITMGSYVIQTGSLNWHPLICAVPFGLLIVALLHANNMRDMLTDLEAGHKNLAYRLGIRNSLLYYAFLIFGAYVLPMVFVFMGHLHRGVFLILITLPLAVRLFRDVWNSEAQCSDVLGSAVIRTAKLSLCFGITMLIGIIGSTLISLRS